MPKLLMPLLRQSEESVPVPGSEYTADILGELADVELTGVFGAVALGRQADELAAEQTDLYEAAGRSVSRSAVVAAAENQVPAQVAESHVSLSAGMVEAAAQHAAATRAALGVYVQRPPSARVFYMVVMVVLAGGDMAAASGAYIMLGEIPALAILLACATGMAAVVGGKIGAEAKRTRLARERQRRPDSLPEELQPWEHLFRGPDAGRKTVRAMVAVSAVIIVALTGGIWALRSALDGATAAAAFALAALAISLGSVVNSYVYASDIDDIIDAADKAVTRTARQQAGFARTTLIRLWRGSLATAGSHLDENTALGSGAGHRVQATRWSVLARTPVLGDHRFEESPGDRTDVGDTPADESGPEPAPGRRARTLLPIRPVNSTEPGAATQPADLEVI